MGMRVTYSNGAGDGLKDNMIMMLTILLASMHTLSFSFARNSTKAACTSASPILPIFRFGWPVYETIGGAEERKGSVVKGRPAKWYATCMRVFQSYSTSQGLVNFGGDADPALVEMVTIRA